MPERDVEALIAAAVTYKTVSKQLLKHNPEAAVVYAKYSSPSLEINLSESDISGLKSITAEKISGFAEACVALGLARGGRI